MEDEIVCLAENANCIVIKNNVRKKVLDASDKKIRCYKTIKGKQWKEIPGFGGAYLISNHGDVWSSKKGGKNLTPYFGRRNVEIKLYHQKQNFTREICRLVASAFLPNYKKGNIVKHLDNDKTNNYFKNLICIERGIGKVKEARKKLYTYQNIKIRDSPSRVTRLMKDGSYKTYSYMHYAVVIPKVGEKPLIRVFNTLEKAENFYLSKKQEYEVYHPHLQPKK